MVEYRISQVRFISDRKISGWLYRAESDDFNSCFDSLESIAQSIASYSNQDVEPPTFVSEETGSKTERVQEKYLQSSPIDDNLLAKLTQLYIQGTQDLFKQKIKRERQEVGHEI
jgi:hypothetical protein